MYQFSLRNIKVFFKDKSSVFFSLLSVFIIIGLYVLFLGDMLEKGLAELGDNTRFLMDTWIMAGVMSVTSITTTMGAFGTLVEDKSNKIIKDFISSPVSRFNIAGGYILSTVFIGIIMSLVTLVLAEIYIVVYGGHFLKFVPFLKVLGLIVLSVIANSSLMYFVVSFFKTSSSYSTATTVLGTLIGFMTGIYIPIGNLPAGIQTIIKLFPPSYSAILFRQVMMEEPMGLIFGNLPESLKDEFITELGVIFKFGNYTVPWWLAVLILVATSLIFFGLSIVRLNKKSK